MKKKKILNICLFSIALFFSFVMITHAATTGCVLGEETTKDVKGALKIFRIVAPLIMLAFTTLDAIKALNSGGTFHFADGGDMPTQKLISRFVKRLIGVLLLFVLPMLIDTVFVFIGIWGPGEGCNLSGNGGSSNNQQVEAEGCYSCEHQTEFRWGTSASVGSGCYKTNNDKCDRSKSGEKFACYKCNAENIYTWGSNQDGLNACKSGAHVENKTKDECHA